MSKPTARELTSGILHGVVMRGTEPDGISKDEALDMASDLAARVERVLALHHPSQDRDGKPVGVCADCGWSLPCPTVRLLNGEKP